jgi:hypothetical protein
VFFHEKFEFGFTLQALEVQVSHVVKKTKDVGKKKAKEKMALSLGGITVK